MNDAANHIHLNLLIHFIAIDVHYVFPIILKRTSQIGRNRGRGQLSNFLQHRIIFINRDNI